MPGNIKATQAAKLRAQRNRDIPFGPHDGVLIVCHDTKHKNQIIEAFKVPAHYCTIRSALVGHRYRTIIVFGPIKNTIFSNAYFNHVIAALKTRLMPNGRLFVI